MNRLTGALEAAFEDPEVHQLDHAIGGHADVGWLDVAMNDRRVATVQVAQQVAELADVGDDQLLGEGRALAAQHFVEIIAGDELHHQKARVAFLEHRVIDRQVRVAQVRERLELAVKAANSGRLEGLFQGEVSRRGVGADRLVDGTKGAVTDHTDDRVASDGVARVV